MRTPEYVSDAEMAGADGILTFDPLTGTGHTVWGSDCVARGVAPGAPAHHVKLVNLEMAADDTAGLLKLLDRIQRVRGRLPRPMVELRAALSA
jgi:hypothetical protein